MAPQADEQKMQKKFIERWENALRVLRQMTPHERKRHFDMSSWGVVTDCGTVACLAGHCSLDPWFRRRGFSADTTFGFVQFSRAQPRDFFGGVGHSKVFMYTSGTYAQIVAATKAHIKYLKAGGAAHWSET